MHIKLCSGKNGVWREEDLCGRACGFVVVFMINREPSARRRSTDSGILSVLSWVLPLSYSFCL